MFVENELRYSDEQIRLFDKVLSELANEIERFARAELSNRLCTAATPLPTLLRQLAFDEAIEVALRYAGSPAVPAGRTVEPASGAGARWSLPVGLVMRF